MTELAHAIARARLLTSRWPNKQTVLDHDTSLTVGDVDLLINAAEVASLAYPMQLLRADERAEPVAHPS